MPGSGDANAKCIQEASPASTMDPAKAAAPLSEGQAANSAAATRKASRRAQGWHSAVGGGAAPGAVGASRTESAAKALGNSVAISTGAAKSSVPFSKADLCSHGSPRPPKPSHGAARDEAADFCRNMADFLTVMYGDKTVRGVVGSDGKQDARHADAEAGSGESDAPVELLASRRGPPPYVSSSCGVSPRGKGPLVKGGTIISGQRSQSDHIGTLVESLVRAYSRRATSMRGDFQGTTGPDDDNPITYCGSRPSHCRRAPASPRPSYGSGAGTGSGHGGEEVSTFVSQAMDNILGPGGIRGQRAVSNLSILSSLGLDKNFSNLMHFPTRSSLQNAIAEAEDSDAVLQPMYVGEQAMFRSVGTKPNIDDISVSKSMQGRASSPPYGFGKDGGLNTTQAPLRGSSGGPRPSSRGLSPPSQRQALGNRKSGVDANTAIGKTGANERVGSVAGGTAGTQCVELCMSLDSKALGIARGADDEDDSWDDEPAGALASKAADGGGPATVASTRSLSDYSKAPANIPLQKALGAVQGEEQLKRDVVMAVAHQLWCYVTSLEQEERAKKGRGAAEISNLREGNAETSAGSAPAAERKVMLGVGGTGADPRSHGILTSDVAPLMRSVIDFFQKDTV
ncbi:hypothetical protein CUR178_02593 [Leishmania enriettii]|uniref:Uncharacterized protein n=1 Tax=Leishmania enriettii TaxID=5663 RepID=A0A836H8A7_LEIEN|nr:hypothetical protein CUR178_02593 [Leishmania enriettii]